MNHRADRGSAAALLFLVAVTGCNSPKSKVQERRPVAGSADAGMPSTSARPLNDAMAAHDATVGADAAKPAAFLAFEALLDTHMKEPPSPARSTATCALMSSNNRAVVLAPGRTPRPANVSEVEWEQTTHAFWDTDIDIAQMCEDMDGKPEGGEDDEVLQLLRQRYEKLVELTSRP